MIFQQWWELRGSKLNASSLEAFARAAWNAALGRHEKAMTPGEAASAAAAEMYGPDEPEPDLWSVEPKTKGQEMAASMRKGWDEMTPEERERNRKAAGEIFQRFGKLGPL